MKKLTQILTGAILLTVGSQQIGGYYPKIEKPKQAYIYEAPKSLDAAPPPNLISRKNLEEMVESARSKAKVPALISNDYIINMISVESSNDASEVSNKYARGLMQIKEDTWYDMTNIPYFPNVFNPRINVEVGVKYLASLYNILKKNYADWTKLDDMHKLDQISAGFNGGINLLTNNLNNIASMSDETQKYVIRINSKLYSGYVYDYIISDSLSSASNQSNLKVDSLAYDTKPTSELQ